MHDTFCDTTEVNDQGDALQASAYVGRCGLCEKQVTEKHTARHGEGHLIHTAINQGGFECGGTIQLFGVCRECGCTHDSPCMDPEPCAWANEDRTLCTACSPEDVPTASRLEAYLDTLETYGVPTRRTLPDLDPGELEDLADELDLAAEGSDEEELVQAIKDGIPTPTQERGDRA